MSDQGEPNREPLQYRNGRLDAPDARELGRDIIRGALTAGVAAFCCFFFWEQTNVPPRRISGQALNWKEPLTMSLVVLAVLGFVVWRQHRRGRRGYTAGAGIVVALALLGAGACYLLA